MTKFAGSVCSGSNGASNGKHAFLLYLSIVMSVGLLLQYSGVLRRADLQTIDRLFEVRSWFTWSDEGLKRLNPQSLVEYHERHEIPRRWWAWDYTLSWLIESNRVKSKEKILIFNHLLEDEPPMEALQERPWLKPLMRYPLSRATLAEIIEFLARSGVRMIVLDNDFPQYSYNDDRLAEALHGCSNGKYSGHKIPVLIAGTIVHRTADSAIQLNYSPPAPGVMQALALLEPGKDLVEEYVGNVSMVMDEDQIVRRCACTLPGLDALKVSSIAVKSLKAVHDPIPSNLPAIMDIDFVGPPNSDLYPVRPLTYLLDPALRSKLTGVEVTGHDVTLRDSIVIIGDGVSDLFATPYTNCGVNLRSGSEIIGQAIDTIARRSWPQRLSQSESVVYLFLNALVGAALWSCRRRVRGRRNSFAGHIAWLFVDLGFYLLTVGLSFVAASMLFAYARLIVPVMVPLASLTIGSLAMALRERESETGYWLEEKLKQTAENLQLEQEKHTSELRAQAAEAQARQIEYSEGVRKDFVRKINHDLKAPVTVMSWTLAKWKQEGLGCKTAGEKLDRMVRTCDRLVSLLHELANNYEHVAEAAGPVITETCELGQLLLNSISMAQSLAESRSSALQLVLPPRRLWVAGNDLELSRVFDNLIRNALIHNPAGTMVRVEVRSQAHRHQIYVSDDGDGIEAGNLKELFDRHIDQAGQEHLGLSIAKGFVEKTGGTLYVTSQRGFGSMFTVTLPSLNLAAGGDICEQNEEPIKIKSLPKNIPVSLAEVPSNAHSNAACAPPRTVTALQAAANALLEWRVIDENANVAVQDFE